MVNRKRSLSSPCIKLEVLDPQLEKPRLITPGMSGFPAAGELLDVKEVVKNFETCPELPNDSLVCPKTETIRPVSNISAVIDQYDPTIGAQSCRIGSNKDPKKMKRLVANRVSAQKARQRKVDHIEKLKQDLKIEEVRVSVLEPQVSYHEVEHVVLRKENDKLKEMIRAFENIKLRKEAEYEALKEKLKELREGLNLPPKDQK